MIKGNAGYEHMSNSLEKICKWKNLIQHFSNLMKKHSMLFFNSCADRIIEGQAQEVWS
jgi:hypothetical protein